MPLSLIMRLTHSALWGWPEVRRGAEREIRDLTRQLARRGHDVHLVTSSRHGLVRRDQDGPVAITRWRNPVVRRFTPESTWSLTALPALATARADLLHAWHYGDGAAASLVRRGRPLVLKITGCVPVDAVELRRLDRKLLRRALEGATEVWVNDAWVVEAMAEWDVPMIVLPPGIDTVAFSPAGSRNPNPTAIAVGPPMDPQKRLSTLWSSWGDVLDVVPEAQLRIAGSVDPVDARHLHAGMPERVRNQVHFLGSLTSEQLVEEYRSAWVCAAPAGNEAFGLSVVEALATGTPVIASSTGALPGLLAGSGDLGSAHGLDDVWGWIQALSQRLTTPPSATESAARADRMSRHALPQRVDEVEARYRTLLDGPD